MNAKELFDYELKGSVWMPIITLVWFDWGQDLIARYMAAKINRKVKRMNYWNDRFSSISRSPQ